MKLAEIKAGQLYAYRHSNAAYRYAEPVLVLSTAPLARKVQSSAGKVIKDFFEEAPKRVAVSHRYGFGTQTRAWGIPVLQFNVGGERDKANRRRVIDLVKSINPSDVMIRSYGYSEWSGSEEDEVRFRVVLVAPQQIVRDWETFVTQVELGEQQHAVYLAEKEANDKVVAEAVTEIRALLGNSVEVGHSPGHSRVTVNAVSLATALRKLTQQ